MKKIVFIIIVLLTFSCSVMQAQKVLTPDLSNVNDGKSWMVFNRTATFKNAIHLDAKENDGLARINTLTFENGKIEFDMKGQNKPGSSFVGFTFHGLNDSTYDAVYFRPFNFKNPERKSHSVQYISHPEYPWFKLRENFPDKYENVVNPVPNPDDWFHVTILIEYPSVKVYVNNSQTPSLVVDQLSTRKTGWLGFWVGNSSEGDFKNLKITKSN